MKVISERKDCIKGTWRISESEQGLLGKELVRGKGLDFGVKERSLLN